MNLPALDSQDLTLIGWGLFALSELIGMSKFRDNAVLELVLHIAQELFPYEVQRREPPTRANRPRPRRVIEQFTRRRNDENRR